MHGGRGIGYDRKVRGGKGRGMHGVIVAVLHILPVPVGEVRNRYRGTAAIEGAGLRAQYRTV